MKERPILFKGEMVRAILDGRKTQTRRIISPAPIQNGFGPPDPVHDIPCHCDSYPPSAWLWPDERGGMLNGDAGHPWCGVDRLWVKETHVFENPDYVAQYKAEKWRGEPDPDKARVHYRATESAPETFARWRPSIFMPRWASRITLEIVDVEAERLNAISEADAKAEGAPEPTGRRGAYPAPWATAKAGPTDYRESYRSLWNKINGRGAWEKNPWVWVITFRRL